MLDVLARALAVLVFDVLRIRRNLILSNLAIAFPHMPETERCRTGRLSIYHFVATAFETFRGGNTNMLAHVQWTNSEVMDQAMARQKGCYLLCAHMGNFEVLGAAIASRWASPTIPVKFVGHGGFDRYVHEQRVRYGILPVRSQRKGDGYRSIQQALAEKRPVGFMLDQARPGQPRLPLFGKPAKTNTSLAFIWQRHPAPLVPLYCRRISFARHEVVFLPEMHPAQTDQPEQDVLNQSLAYNTIVEQMIRACPEQYWWIHNRWK